jgi:aspartyl/asparaginyl-tRNA synthetase
MLPELNSMNFVSSSEFNKTLVRDTTTAIKETTMKTGETPEKKISVVYRKDGKTPDLRYKSSREYVLSQHAANNKEQKKDWKTVDLRYIGMRDHVLLHQTAIAKDIPVQIKPAGKKPVWKVSS